MKKSIYITVFLIILIPFTNSLAQDEVIFHEWKTERNQKVVDVINNWLIDGEDEINSENVVDIIRLSINMLSFTRQTDPYLEVDNPECIQAQVFEAWLKTQGIALDSKDIFLGRPYYFTKVDRDGKSIKVSALQ